MRSSRRRIGAIGGPSTSSASPGRRNNATKSLSLAIGKKDLGYVRFVIWLNWTVPLSVLIKQTSGNPAAAIRTQTTTTGWVVFRVRRFGHDADRRILLVGAGLNTPLTPAGVGLGFDAAANTEATVGTRPATLASRRSAAAGRALVTLAPALVRMSDAAVETRQCPPRLMVFRGMGKKRTGSILARLYAYAKGRG